MNTELEALDKYINSLKETDSSHIQTSDISEKELDDEILSLQQQIKQTKNQIQKITNHKKQWAIKYHELRILSDNLVDQINVTNIKYCDLQEESNSLTKETNRCNNKLEKFMQINSINDAFHIWYAGPYGTISGFKLGSLPAKPIESFEINAGLGQAALLLDIIAKSIGFEFRLYVITPYGSFPKISKAEDRKISFPFYIDQGSFSLFPKRNFNYAILGFMTCLSELGEYVSSYDPTMAMPYKINLVESKIHDISFVYGVDDEIWTRSLKYMLSNLKWIVAWYTKHGINA